MLRNTNVVASRSFALSFSQVIYNENFIVSNESIEIFVFFFKKKDILLKNASSSLNLISPLSLRKL